MSRSEYTIIFEAVHGSRAYGLAHAESDTDLKGVMVGPRSWYHGFCHSPEQVEASKDHVHYEIRKLFRLAVSANPTILELLWVDPEDYRIVTPAGQRLLECRAHFLSKRVSETFVGYALSQLKRIKGHRNWLLAPPSAAPQRSDYALPQTSLIARDQQQAVEILIAEGRLEEAELTPNFVEIMKRERAYRNAKREWDNYQSWKKNRNPDRAALEAQFGYDTKHAQHLVRILRMGAEVMRDGVVRVRRDDAEELRAIRAGAWTYEDLVANAEALAEEVLSVADASPLPDAPDHTHLNRLCAELVEGVIG